MGILNDGWVITALGTEYKRWHSDLVVPGWQQREKTPGSAGGAKEWRTLRRWMQTGLNHYCFHLS